MTRSFIVTAFCQRTAAALAIASVVLAQPSVTPGQTPIVPSKPASERAVLKPFKQEVPVAAYSIEMLPVPGSTDGSIKPFFMSKTEIGWEAFDVYVYRLDEEAGKGPKNADAVTRPSKPYLPPDRGFGHEGYAAISMSHHNAAEFCRWLSEHTGRTYRLPTEAEWEHAATVGVDGTPTTLSTGTAVPADSKIDDAAWHHGNSSDTPHPLGKKKPNALGLHDMLGNVAEWVSVKDGKPVAKGGSYKDTAEKLIVSSRQISNAAWNASDPQIPKSKWWLSDAPFIGFRIVCEAPAVSNATPLNPPVHTPATSTSTGSKEQSK